ncbi:MAG: hypothetical protein HY817_04230 [Candidatus Abawacabacteria bacterium]|nr:hypothetical protein [Candidatus Abawacabacteria bacterium]
MYSTCPQCYSQFAITQDDLDFYEKVSPVIAGKKYLIPEPTLCPPCRQQRRMARRNERKLYNRKCNFSGKQIISIYSSDSPYKVYESKIWWSDEIDAKQYGQSFDFSRPFFEQFYELQQQVPRPSLFNKTVENSEYSNHADQLKSCYLIMNGGLCENCMYGNWIVSAKDCVDCSYIEGCELCYETSYSVNCYNCHFSIHCENCSDSTFLYDCKSVQHCTMCVGLRNKEYCILNQQYSKEEYEQKLTALQLHSFNRLQSAKEQFQELLLKAPHRSQFIVNSENCSGENIYNCRNAEQCFYVHNSQDTKYCYNSLGITDGYDVYETGMECELQIETHAMNRSKNVGFSSASYDNSNIWYCDLCHNSQNLFGCIGLKGEKYCILNKQYSKEEYEILVPQIIVHMQATGEWGEFFPIPHAPFSYNETLANEAFPMTKEAVLAKSWLWHEDKLGSTYQGEVVKVPDTSAEATDTFIEKILTCEKCQKHYRLIKQELNFYREHLIPIPHCCIECRHRHRTAETNRITLFSRNCAKCKKTIETTYPPTAPEVIYCEDCYLRHTY